MSPTTRQSARGGALAALAVIAALVAVLVVVATGVLGGGAASPTPVVPGSPSPSTPPAGTPGASPSAPPSDEPSASPSPSPSPSLPAGVDFDVDLDVATPHDVSVVVVDDTDLVVDARSGRASDGMSVRWYDVLVENQDIDTLRVTWVGFPQDEVVELAVSWTDAGLRLRFVADGPPPNSDGLGYDRVLYLDLSEPVRAEDVRATIQGSLDTEG